MTTPPVSPAPVCGTVPDVGTPERVVTTTDAAGVEDTRSHDRK
jgi:hypothetical protein